MRWCACGPPARANGSTRGNGRNLAGAFRVAGRAHASAGGWCIILVDDVLTIGATADACARVLKQAGAGSVRLLTLARVVRAADASHIAS